MDSKDKKFSIDEAVKIITDEASKKFVEAIDVAVNLGIDPVKTDQAPLPLVPFLGKDTHDFVLWFVLAGTAFFERSNGAALQRVSESDSITLINVSQEDMGVAFRDSSEDFALLEVCLPHRSSEN